MDAIKQLKTIKIHPSGWPFIAVIAMLSLLICFLLGLNVIFFVCSTFITIYLFRVQIPTTSSEHSAITAPLSGKILQIAEIISPHKIFFLNSPIQKIVIRCGLSTAASVHAPTSMKILQKQRIQEAFGRSILIRASVLASEENSELEEIMMIFSSSIPYLFPECNIEIEDTLSKGQNFGFIPFGGKLDLLVPTNFSLLTIENQTSISGETVLAMRR